MLEKQKMPDFVNFAAINDYQLITTIIKTIQLLLIGVLSVTLPENKSFSSFIGVYIYVQSHQLFQNYPLAGNTR